MFLSISTFTIDHVDRITMSQELARGSGDAKVLATTLQVDCDGMGRHEVTGDDRRGTLNILECTSC